MKPTKMRNQMIYRASQFTKSKQVSSPLSKDLQKKYNKKSIRVVEGDSIKIVRGEFKGVDGKVGEISVQKSSLAVEGVKKEKTKGDKFDVFVHSSNVIVTGLNSTDKWRMAKLEGKKVSKKEIPTEKTETKEEPKREAKLEETKEKVEEKTKTTNEKKVEKTEKESED